MISLTANIFKLLDEPFGVQACTEGNANELELPASGHDVAKGITALGVMSYLDAKGHSVVGRETARPHVSISSQARIVG